MRKISGHALSSKPVSLSRAAKLVSRFAAVDNGSSAVVSLYLQRTADAFNHLVQFHNKRLKSGDVENSPDRKRALKSEKDWVERNPDGKSTQDSKSRGKKVRETVNEFPEANPYEEEVQNLGIEEKKRKKRKSDAVDSSNNGVENMQSGEEEKKKKKNKKRNSDPEANPSEDELQYLKSGEEKKVKKLKKKTKRASDDAESMEKIDSNLDAKPNEDDVQILDSGGKRVRKEKKKKKNGREKSIQSTLVERY